MNLIAALVFTMSVSVYAPDAGGINGGGLMADGNEPRFGYAACGPQFPFGTIFEIVADIDMSSRQLPQIVECRDRGSMIGRRNLDLVIRTGDVNQDLAIARAFGRRRLRVRVWPGWNTWHETRLAADGAPLRFSRRPGTNPAQSHAPPDIVSTALRTRRSRV